MKVVILGAPEFYFLWSGRLCLPVFSGAGIWIQGAFRPIPSHQNIPSVTQWSRAPPSRSWGREEEGRACGAQSHGLGVRFPGSFLTSVLWPHLHKGYRSDVYSPALGTIWPGLFPFSAIAHPRSFLLQFLLPPSLLLLPWQTGQARGGHGAQRKEAALGSQRALSGLGRGQEMDTSRSLCIGDGVCFCIIVYIPWGPPTGPCSALVLSKNVEKSRMVWETLKTDINCKYFNKLL